MASKTNPVGWRFEAGQRVTAHISGEKVHGTIESIRNESVILKATTGEFYKVTDKQLARGWR